METIKIDTSQNIDIEQPVASIGERIAATMLDLLFILSFAFIVALIGSRLNYGWIISLFYLPISVYNLVSELSMDGQSWGKKILKIKVVKIDGTPASFSSYFLRWVFRLIEILAAFGSIAMITIILNRKGQRLGDIAANTTVIRVRNNSLKETIYTPIPENYTVVYPEVFKLSVNDIYTIKEVSEILKPSNPTLQKLKLAQKTQEAIERKLNIKSNQNPVAFFRTILRDYNYINNRL